MGCFKNEEPIDGILRLYSSSYTEMETRLEFLPQTPIFWPTVRRRVYGWRSDVRISGGGFSKSRCTSCSAPPARTVPPALGSSGRYMQEGRRPVLEAATLDSESNPLTTPPVAGRAADESTC